MANWSGAGGLNQGRDDGISGKGRRAGWQRSMFNGLAQILVQSAREPGGIKLTARAGRPVAGHRDRVVTETLYLTPARP